MLNNFLDSKNRKKNYDVHQDNFEDNYTKLNKTLPKENVTTWE